ncbi:MAG: methyltransferase domain-containing protein [Rectinema sp.]|nr:methyltransferase domain-containing protein [Rectinema sp.]
MNASTPASSAPDPSKPHDRVYDAYVGKLGTEFMRKTQQRIHWLCTRVVGKQILDVGTSQGLIPILLAREGKFCCGIDSDGHVIAEARAYLALEEPAVQARVEFRHADFLSVELAGPFDTVVMAEVLEHVLDAQAFIAKAADLLRPGGRLLVTTPFGINDWPDHKHTFYAHGILKQLASWFVIHEFACIEAWFAVAAERATTANADRSSWDWETLVRTLEQAFYQRERALVDQVRESLRKLENHKKQSQQAQAEWAKRLEGQQATIESLRSELAAARQAHSEMQRLQNELQRLASERQEWQALRERHALELQQLHTALATANAKAQYAEERHRDETAELQRRVNQLQARCEDLERSERQISASATAEEAKFEAYRTLATTRWSEYERRCRDLEQQLVQARQEAQERAAAAARAEQRVIDLEAQLASLRDTQTTTERALDALRQQALNSQQKQLELETDLASTQQRLQQALQEREAALRTCEELRQQQQLLQNAYDRQRVEQEAALQQMQAAYVQCQHERDIAAQRLQALEQRVSFLSDAISKLEQQRRAAEQALAELHRSAQSERESAQLRCRELERDLTEARQEAASWRQSAQDMQAARERAEQYSAALKKDFEAYRAQTQQECEVIRQQLAQAQDAAARESQRAERLVKELAELSKAIYQERLLTQQRVIDLEQRMQQMLGELAEARTALAETSAQLRAAQQALAQRDDRIAQLDAELLGERRVNEDLAQRIRDLEQGMQNLRAELVTARETLAKSLSERVQLQSDLATQHRCLSAREEHIAALRHENHQLSDVISQLRAQILELTRTNLETGAQLSRAQHARDEAQRQAHKLKATISYRLGQAILKAGHSWQAAAQLPLICWRLRREVIARRRASQAITQGPTASPEPPPSHAELASPVPAPLPPTPAATPRQAKPLSSLCVAAILDPFSARSFAPDCQLLELLPDSWQETLEAQRPDFLLVESAWQGKQDSWRRKIAQREQPLPSIVSWCRERGIPTVFWNKEDPVHFETFLNTAALFDYVCTTDVDSIPRYRRLLRHDRVHLLHFAVQPAHHHPLATQPRKDAFCFAGAYYVRYPERARDFESMLLHLPAFKPVEIFDRNFDKEDPNYQFPAVFKPFIVGSLPPERIDEAYKGYRYAINLNSIKYSQSMFARRVFELLASNTVTVSNYARGLSLFFGDLIIMSDDGAEIVRRLRSLSEWDEARLRVAALRRVMSEHTVRDRLARLARIAQIPILYEPWPTLLVVGFAQHNHDVALLQSMFAHQAYPGKKHLVIVGAAGGHDLPSDISVLDLANARHAPLRSFASGASWLAAWSPEDYYGPQYLTDLVLASRYSDADVIGKGAHFAYRDDRLQLQDAAQQYVAVESLPKRRAIVRSAALDDTTTIFDWLHATPDYRLSRMLAIDPFHYIAQGSRCPRHMRTEIEDLPIFSGLPLSEIETIGNASTSTIKTETEVPSIPGQALAAWFSEKPGPIALKSNGSGLIVTSQLPDGQHDYRYAQSVIDPQQWRLTENTIRLHLVASPGLLLQFTLVFCDARDQRIKVVNLAPNLDHSISIPPSTVTVRPGIRVQGPGQCVIERLCLGHLGSQGSAIQTTSNTLLLTNHYPEHGDLYRNAFVHRRVVGYAARQQRVEVVRVRSGIPLRYHRYDGVDCISVSHQLLPDILRNQQIRTVLIHFLDQELWRAIAPHIVGRRVLVWVHGAEIQAPVRRIAAFGTEQERQHAQEIWEHRRVFWRQLLTQMPDSMHVVFVSRWLAETALADLQVTLSPDRYSIIPNPIDTELFVYKPKVPELRKRVLSIRPYSNPLYANDVLVKALLLVS